MLRLVSCGGKIPLRNDLRSARISKIAKISSNAVEMIDVASKPPTDRTAIAEAIVRMPTAVLEEIRRGNIRKGDPFTVSQIAGIMGAKNTPDILPLCHNIKLSKVHVEIAPDYDNGLIRVRTFVKVAGEKTGVEMEALTSACISALNIYDMCKYLSHDITISDVRLLHKTGGKSNYEFK